MWLPWAKDFSHDFLPTLYSLCQSGVHVQYCLVVFEFEFEFLSAPGAGSWAFFFKKEK
jgi:hypothetical protein